MNPVAIGEVLADARDQWDLWYAFIIGLPALVAAVAALWNRREAKARWEAQEQKHDAVLYEVRNSHRTNLRDDLDLLKDLVQDGFSETRKDHASTRDDIRGLREEIRTERFERIEGDRQRALGDR